MVLALILMAGSAMSQKYKVVSGNVHFYSHAPLEDIEADNSAPQGLVNLLNNEFAFIIPINKFEFEKDLMKEHFNEKYLHSDKFPKAIFSGTLGGISQKSTAWQMTTATGKLTIHGVSQTVKMQGKVKLNGTKMEVQCEFKVKLDDHNIVVPSAVGQNIAEVIDVKVNFVLEKQ